MRNSLMIVLYVFCITIGTLAQAPPPASFGNPIGLPEVSGAGQGTGGVAVADTNNDGRADILLDDPGGGSVFSVVQNPPNSDGSLSFNFPIQLQTGNSGSEVGIATGDFNGDGKVDFVIGGEGNGGGDINLFLGHGDGTFPSFANPNDLPELYGNCVAVGCDSSSTVGVGDFNGDGKLDAVFTMGTSTLVLLGNGDGTFQSIYQVQSSLVGYPGPASIAVGDFNGDGKLDIAVTRVYTGTCAACTPSPGGITVLLGNGDGTFQQGMSYDIGASLGGIADGDLNGDGKIDLVVTNFIDNTSSGDSVSVFLGNGDGTFPQAPSATYAVPDIGVAVLRGTSLIVIGDFNSDGKPDLAVPTGAATGAAVAVLIGNGDVNGTFRPATYYGAGLGDTHFIAIGDVNGDGRPDLVFTNNAVSLPGGPLVSGYVMLNTTSYMNTATGTSVAVQPFNNATGTSPVSVTYSSITQSGLTTLTSNPTAAPSPTNFQVAGSSTYYDLSTTAVFTGSATVCVSYNPASFTNTADIRLLHYVSGTWSDVTTSVDTVNFKVCGSVTSFSPFVVAQATYNAQVQQPINSDGSSVFSASKGVVPVKFNLTQNNVSTCTLPTASIVVTRLSGSSPGTLDESIYTMSSDNGIYYRNSGCQYVYNLSSKSLGAGGYRVDVVIGNAVVGSGYFGLK